jgi:hypothetical protein
MARITDSCASCCFTLLFVLAGAMLAAIPIASWFYWENYIDSVPAHTLAWLIASCFVAVTLPMSLWEIVMHLRYWNMPLLQVPVVRVLWMVPIYAIDSWLALRFSWTKYRSISSYICVARECYEAFVVYNFFLFLARYVAITAVQDRRRSAPRGDHDSTAIAPVHRLSTRPSPSSRNSRSAAFNASFNSEDSGEQTNSLQDVLGLSRLNDSSEVYSVASGMNSTDGLTNVRAVEARLRGGTRSHKTLLRIMCSYHAKSLYRGLTRFFILFFDLFHNSACTQGADRAPFPAQPRAAAVGQLFHSTPRLVRVLPPHQGRRDPVRGRQGVPTCSQKPSTLNPKP